LEDLTLWDYDPNAIKLTPYYNKLLQWCDSVDIIRIPSYTGDPVRYPSREIDSIGSEDMSDLLVDELLDYLVLTSSPGSTDFIRGWNMFISTYRWRGAFQQRGWRAFCWWDS